MDKLTIDAKNMMERFSSGWSMRVMDMEYYFPNKDYAIKVFKRMVELAN